MGGVLGFVIGWLFIFLLLKRIEKIEQDNRDLWRVVSAHQNFFREMGKK